MQYQNGNRRTIRILSNMARIAAISHDRYTVVSTFIDGKPTVWNGVRLFFKSLKFDAVVICSETRRLLVFSILRRLFPVKRARIIAVDYILPKPNGLLGCLMARIKGFFLRSIDRFILHFPDSRGYELHYGIESNRCAYVPFKVNYLERIQEQPPLCSDGEYIFTAGRSLRDIPTFVRALEMTSYPGLLLYEDVDTMRRAGTVFDMSSIPPNVRLQKNESEVSWVDLIAKAKVVVVPLLQDAGYAAGLSLYLMAMAMKKCVVITEGLSTRGMITNCEAVLVPPGDAEALAAALKRVWEDDDLRERIACCGQRYAESLGGEQRLLRDIVKICGEAVEAADNP